MSRQPAAQSGSEFSPIRLLEVELSRSLPAVSPTASSLDQQYRYAHTLVRLHGQPLGVIDHPLPEEGLRAAQYAALIWRELAPVIQDHVRQDGGGRLADLSPAGLPNMAPACLEQRHASPLPATVVVATRDRPDTLRECLDSLLAMDYPRFEIVVVDSASASTATADLVRDRYAVHGSVRYVREDRPGLAIAHNRGIQEVKTPVVAFTDDDVVVDRDWLGALVDGFSAAENVGCVTGLIFPAEIETQAQAWTERYWGYSKGYTRRLFDLHDNRVRGFLYPYTAGIFGSGANMAFRTSVLRAIGGFDPALGAGTLARGGDDLAAFFRTIKKGFGILYEPAAIVYHRHRRAMDALPVQARGYGTGLAAYLSSILVDRPWLALDLMIRGPVGLAYLLSPRSSKNGRRPTEYPRDLVTAERAGMLLGPIAYVRSRWRTRVSRRRLRYIKGVWETENKTPATGRGVSS